jgi:hypothetical protein
MTLVHIRIFQRINAYLYEGSVFSVSSGYYQGTSEEQQDPILAWIRIAITMN